MNKEKMFVSGTWIGYGGEIGKDEYTEFTDSFEWQGGTATVSISVSGDYTLFINGKYAASNQYADFEYYKVYDEIDITDFLKHGTNTLAVIGWYWDQSGMRWYTPTPGILYEIENGGKILCVSTPSTLCRKSKAYLSGRAKKITPQLGYAFLYDANSEDDWTNGSGKDFGKETVGICSFSLNSETIQNLNISFGEILENGPVKKNIGERDFSFDYVTKPGENTYTNYMLRFGCRYMEINCEKMIEINSFQIIPMEYEVNVKAKRMKTETDQRIYDMCVNTLKLCMMEHYVDCPWREQCLYAFDSRNQMLAGYYAFEGGNYEYARANLLLMSKDHREEGLLSIC